MLNLKDFIADQRTIDPTWQFSMLVTYENDRNIGWTPKRYSGPFCNEQERDAYITANPCERDECYGVEYLTADHSA